MRKPIFFVTSLLVLVALACSFNFSTANIADAKLTKDAEGNEPTTTFAQDDTFYLIVELANAPDDTSVKAAWTAVEADNIDPNFSIGDKELVGGDVFNFTLSNDQLWPVGQYKVDIYLNDELTQTLEFEVEGDVVAQEPTAAPPTPTPEPTATPEPTEPTQASTGDSLSIEPTPTPEEEYEPLPFQEEPYVHPSEAFSFLVPEAWEGIAGDEASVSFGTDDAIVGVIFRDAGEVFSDKEMQEFSDLFVDGFIGNIGDSYEVVVEEEQPDDSLYVGVVYDSAGGGGDADFFFEQRETVVFILYFITTRYEELTPTWNEIIASYWVDPEAALAAAPAAAPTPAPPPAPAGPSAPAGKGLFVFRNTTGVDFVIDVIGPTNDSQVIPPNSSKEFVLEPGHYTINGHSPGGDYFIDAYQFDIAAGQVFPLTLN